MLTLPQAIERYLNHLRVLARSAKTLRLYRAYLRHHAAWLYEKGVHHPQRVRLAVLEKYVRYLLARYAQNPTAARVRLLRRFYGFLVETGVMDENPAKALHVPKENQDLLPAPPDADTIYKVVANQNPQSPVGQRDRAMIETFFATGLRLSEMLALEIGDVRLKDKSILVRSGKGKKDRVVLLSDRAASALSLYLEKARPALASGLVGHNGWREHRRRNDCSPHKALWLAAHGGLLSEGYVRQRFVEWSELVDCPFHAHLLRHAFAVHLLRKGADIRHVQALLGHESLDTTKVYLRLVKEDYKKAYDRAFPVIRLPLVIPRNSKKR